MSRYIIFTLLIILAIFTYTCKDIFVTDISDTEVFLLAPPDGHHTEDYTIQFWWEYVDDATGYNLTIVSPSFERINKLVVDTNLTDNIFEYTLYPDSFEWSLSAYNSGFATDYFIRQLIVDSTEKPQEVIMIYPKDTFLITNEDTITFSWQKSENAEEYAIELHKGSRKRFNDYISETYISFPDNNYGTPKLEDGEYTFIIWSVNEKYDISIPTRSDFLIDRVAPANPMRTSPLDNDTVYISDDPLFEWTIYQDDGSNIYSLLFIYKDSVNQMPDILEV
ncbi:MAG: hypothetical protein JXB17_10515, partial [Bacteroidales bacterium]|nr:hypothetical protein [Bacteroidales bacterium]